MKYQAIFFDMDGLLVDTEPLAYQSTKEVFAAAGVDLTREWFVQENLGKGRSCAELLREKGFAEKKMREILDARYKRYGDYLEAHLTVVDGVFEVLEQLRGRLSLAIVTGSKREFFDIKMRKTGLQHFFDFFVVSEDTENHKPNPEPYLKALERSKKENDQCLVLEDSGIGLQAAKAAGLQCYAIPDEMTKSHDFSTADKVLKSIREVPALVL